MNVTMKLHYLHVQWSYITSYVTTLHEEWIMNATINYECYKNEHYNEEWIINVKNIEEKFKQPLSWYQIKSNVINATFSLVIYPALEFPYSIFSLSSRYKMTKKNLHCKSWDERIPLKPQKEVPTKFFIDQAQM